MARFIRPVTLTAEERELLDRPVVGEGFIRKQVERYQAGLRTGRRG